MTPDRRNPEQGSALILALVFITVIALVITALLGQANTSVRVTSVVREHTEQLYAADAGLQHALEALRLDRTICPVDNNVSTPVPDLAITVNDHPVTITCETTAGASSGADGYAVIAMSTSASGIETGGSASGPKIVEGPVYARRLENFGSGGLEVHGGFVHEQLGTGCTASSSAPGGLAVTPSPPFSWRCVSTAPPVPAHGLPGSQPAPAAAFVDVPDANPSVGGNQPCRVFYPGTYTTAPALANDNFFTSGTYYFANIGEWQIGDTIVGGERHTLETKTNDASNCDAHVDTGTGTGVKWILGGSSWINVRNHGEVELFSRSGGSGEGQDGISLQAIQTGDAWGAPSTAATLVDASNGSTVQFTSHGMVYAPSEVINFQATNDSRAQLQGGLVVERIIMSASASASGLVVSVREAPFDRQMVVTATAPNPDDATAVWVRATAVVTLENDTNRTFQVESWRSSRVPAGSTP